MCVQAGCWSVLLLLRGRRLKVFSAGRTTPLVKQGHRSSICVFSTLSFSRFGKTLNNVKYIGQACRLEGAGWMFLRGAATKWGSVRRCLGNDITDRQYVILPLIHRRLLSCRNTYYQVRSTLGNCTQTHIVGVAFASCMLSTINSRRRKGSDAQS